MSTHPDRRTVLKGAGAAALAAGTGVAAGCSDGATGGQAKPSASSAGGSVTVRKADVPADGGVVLDKKYVVTQPGAGTFKAFTKICPHQGCSVSFIKNKQIVCACHGSEFSITDGQPTAGPAKKGLTEAPVKVDGDNLQIG